MKLYFYAMPIQDVGDHKIPVNGQGVLGKKLKSWKAGQTQVWEKQHES